MTPTVDELGHAIYRLGCGEMLTRDFRSDVLDRLVELNMVHVEVDTTSMLTDYGWQAYSKLIDGSDMPEFEFDLPKGE